MIAAHLALRSSTHWLVRARLLRLVLSQHVDGFWEPTKSVATALRARSALEVAAARPPLATRLLGALGALLADESLADEETVQKPPPKGGGGGAAAAGAPASDAAAVAADRKRAEDASALYTAPLHAHAHRSRRPSAAASDGGLDGEAAAAEQRRRVSATAGAAVSPTRAQSLSASLIGEACGADNGGEAGADAFPAVSPPRASSRASFWARKRAADEGAPAAGNAGDDDAAAAVAAAEAAGLEFSDCPLAGCTSDALLAPCPSRLAVLPPSSSPSRVWATLLVVSCLEELDISWLATDGELYPKQEETILDAAEAWLARHAAAHADVAAVLADGKVRSAARRAIVKWAWAWDARVGELRRSAAIVAHRSRSHVDRTMAGVVVALRQRHEYLATFLSEPLDGLQRWQRWVVLLTLVLMSALHPAACARFAARSHAHLPSPLSLSCRSAHGANLDVYALFCVLTSPFAHAFLFTSVYTKSVNCCAELRLILDDGPDGGNCPPGAGLPCRGFTGAPSYPHPSPAPTNIFGLK